jgi:hypothetical protein
LSNKVIIEKFQVKTLVRSKLKASQGALLSVPPDILWLLGQSFGDVAGGRGNQLELCLCHNDQLSSFHLSQPCIQSGLFSFSISQSLNKVGSGRYIECRNPHTTPLFGYSVIYLNIQGFFVPMFQSKGKIYRAPVADSFLVEDCNGPYEYDDIDECPGWKGDAPTENEYKEYGTLHGYGYIGNGAAQSHVMEGHYLGGIGGFGEDGGLPGRSVGNSVCSPFRASLTIPTKSGMP